ncbi:MAG: pyridine nucleotide-disulfide oxidoreductase, partial [Actinobacteria bacterium]|nr:pyridine nucleotide-disulfide oxidoreductase [Actinomycetota bacterium]
MPSKALLRPGEVLAADRRVPAARPAVTGNVDVEAALHVRDGFTSDWNDESQAQWLAGVGVDVVRGRGRLAGERTVEVQAQDGPPVTLTARKAVVIEGLRDIAIWDNRDVTAAKRIPERLLVLGGGVVGSE